LEALRGAAALIVVLYHCMMGYLPQYSGYIPGHADNRLQGSVFFIFVNGPAAVCLFFVLSGYVLTRRYCESGDTRILLKGAVKRWPRLAGPVLVTTFISYALFFLHLYDFNKAGIKSGSLWLTEFGNGFAQVHGPYATLQSIHYWNMLLQGAFLTFFRGDWLFDSSLWTMKPELMGSLIAFGIAPILLEARKASVWATLWLVAVVLAVLHFAWPILAAFPIGVALAVSLPSHYVLRLRFAIPALLVSFYLLGYSGSAAGAYKIFGYLTAYGMPDVYPQIAGAAMLISLIEIVPPLRNVFSGKISAWLGDLSFPIYLVHVLIICSAGSFVYVRFGALPAIISVFLISILAALPLMRFNNWWMFQVNAVTAMLLRSRRFSAARP
jgi:peptidoglycan/LPS O-acetylase OafA/YrhL